MTPVEIQQLADAIAERMSSRPSSNDELMDVNAVAEFYGCSVPTVERLTKSGEIPSLKVGRLRRYCRADLLRARNAKGGRNE